MDSSIGKMLFFVSKWTQLLYSRTHEKLSQCGTRKRATESRGPMGSLLNLVSEFQTRLQRREVAFLSQSLPLTTTYMGTRVHTRIKKRVALWGRAPGSKL